MVVGDDDSGCSFEQTDGSFGEQHRVGLRQPSPPNEYTFATGEVLGFDLLTLASGEGLAIESASLSKTSLRNGEASVPVDVRSTQVSRLGTKVHTGE